MKTITEQFLAGIKWNTLEACLYQGILWGYHFMLFSTFDRSFYGTVGVIFSLLFMGVTFLTLGLDSALSPFIRHYTQSKASFRALMGRQFVPNLIIYGGLLLLVSFYDLNHLFSLFGVTRLDQSFILVLALLLILESIKKVIKSFLGLLFYNQQLATLEIIYILLYVMTIARIHYSGIPITLYALFLPMAIYSALTVGVLGVWLYNRYEQLPDLAYEPEATLAKRMNQSRFFGYINQVGHLLFSGNMLVAVFAAQTNVAYAAVAKILSTSIQTISNVINRIIGQPSEAALAHAHAYAADQKQSLFALANRYTQIMITTLFVLGFGLNYSAIATHAMNATLHTHALLVVFGILLLIEPFFITYEKKYLIEERGHYLSYYHLTMMLLFGLWVYLKCALPLLCLIGFTIVRLAWYQALGMQSINPRSISRSTSLNVIICLIVMGVVIIFC
jgi:hypothetical protein